MKKLLVLLLLCLIATIICFNLHAKDAKYKRCVYFESNNFTVCDFTGNESIFCMIVIVEERENLICLDKETLEILQGVKQ